MHRVWIGRRVVKTGIAVFVTASLCHLLGLPPAYAVITAIMTIEPTAVDSLKKRLGSTACSCSGSCFCDYNQLSTRPKSLYLCRRGNPDDYDFGKAKARSWHISCHTNSRSDDPRNERECVHRLHHSYFGNLAWDYRFDPH